MLWLYLHFHHLLLDHIARSREDQAPLAIISEPSRRVLQACPRAMHQGIRPGIPLKTALNLAPELVMVQADDEQQKRILEQQAQWLYRYMDRITLYPPDGLLAEAGSLRRLYGGLPQLREQLTRALEERCLNTTITTGSTPMAARLLARAGMPIFTGEQQLLKEHLEQLPLEHAGFEPATVQRLVRLGLSRLGEVAALPAAELARRLAPETLVHLQKVQGQRPDPQSCWQPPRHFHQQADFGLAVEKTQGLLFALRRILVELENDLLHRQQDTDSLVLILRHHQQAPTRMRIRTTGPEHRAEAFLNLLRIRLEQQPLVAPVESLELTVTRFLERHTPADGDLLGDGVDQEEAWHTLVSRLQARLGEQTIRHLAPAADHRPERAWNAREIRDRSRSTREADVEHLPLRPLWLMRQPQPLRVVPDTWFAGPERISGGWWDGEKVLRDYYIARLPEGQLAWVYRDCHDGWFVHGWFG
ncbi:protein ImuB [Marinobacter daqiaonensis]|uniref:Protein ImuB n=1 Tax=Marinobacter daqiaonensis TaxID=650891 RepID=A0A1I6GGQ8_9GAMM|nr:DNA polymerase Y family protein [Marinobacter daqiaonensis]SFR41413.1 protein ImuB [Marinobacter daqiaonensis]